MYHSKAVFYHAILFLVLQIKISGNIVNAEAYSPMYGIKNLTNELDEPVLCDLCVAVINTCFQNHSECECFMCRNEACQSCFKGKKLKISIEVLQNQDIQLDSEINAESIDHAPIEEILPTEGLQSNLVEVQNSRNEFEEIQKPVNDSYEIPDMTKQNHHGNYSNSTGINHIKVNILTEVVKFCSFAFFVILTMVVLVFTWCPKVFFCLDSEDDEKRPSGTDYHYHYNVPTSETAPVGNPPPPPYEAYAKEKCTLVPMEVDESQPKAEYV